MKRGLFFLCLFTVTVSSLVVMAAVKSYKKAPDLVITKVKATPTTKENTKILIMYTVKNQGTLSSEATMTNIYLSSGEAAVQQPLPPLSPGQSYTVSCLKTVGKKGNYQMKVTADYNNKVPESNEGNNENILRFGIGRSL